MAVDPNMVGISPSGIADMTRSLERNLNDAVHATSSLRAAFAEAQVPTDTIDSIYRTLGIVQDELPMLKRRHSLALAIDSNGDRPFDGTGKLPKGMVVQGAGRMTFTSDAQAAQAGKADAKALAEALGRGRPDDVRPLLQRLKANSGDSVYADALVDVLGPEGVARVSDWGQGAERNGQDKDAKLAYSGMGNALAMASHQIADPGKWLDGAVLPNASTGYPTKAVAPLLAYGDYDPGFLERVGKRELGAAVMVHDPERSKQIWDALARNPRAASLLYQLDMPEIAGYTGEKRPLVHGESKTIAEFAKVARAATMGVRRLDPHEADASVRALIDYYRTNPNFHTYDQMRNVYADLTKERWADIVYSVSTPVDLLTKNGDDPTRVGVEFRPAAWANFLTDTMRHAPAAAEVLNQERAWANSTDEKIYEKIMHTPDGAAPDKWERTAIAEMNALFTASASDALAQLKQKDQQRADGWLKNVTLAFSEVKKNNVDIGGYFKDGANLLKAREAEKLQEYAKSLMTKYFGDSDTQGVDKAIGSIDYRNRWQQHAQSVWEAAVRSNSGHLPSVDYDGRPWTGDPSYYEHKYNTKFTYIGSDKKTHILDANQLGKGTDERNHLDGWQQLHAYNEWLKDPAVVRMIAKGAAGDVSEHSDGN
jgi:hypothetical protein